MRVHDHQPVNPAIAPDKNQRANKAPAQTDSANPVADSALAGDKLTFSGIQERVAAPDEARLEQLRSAVADGTYSVPSAQISDRLIAEHLKDQ